MSGINGTTFSAASVRLRWNTSALGGVLSLELPEFSIKEEQLVLLGDQTPSVRTEGIAEIGKATATLTGTGWASWLAVLPDQYMNCEFPLTGNQRNVQIPYSYSTILDRCRITKHKPGKWGGDEKSTNHDLELSCMNVLVRGADGQWKTPARRPGDSPLTSPAAQALMF